MITNEVSGRRWVTVTLKWWLPGAPVALLVLDCGQSAPGTSPTTDCSKCLLEADRQTGRQTGRQGDRE